MYLKNVALKNIGPILNLNVEMPFDEGGNPKPIIFVGENGTGKTILESQIADAFYEIAGNLFNDVAVKNGLSKSFYKLSGPLNITTREDKGFSLLRFSEKHERNLEYFDKTGDINKADFEKFITDFSLTPSGKNSEKNITTINDSQKETLKKEWNSGVYFYQPAYRYEEPFWKNEIFKEKYHFEDKRRFSGKLDKEFEIVSSMTENKSYLLDLVLDHEVYKRESDKKSWENINNVLKKIKRRDDISLGIGPRGRYRVALGERDSDGKWVGDLVPSIDSLSLGESVLLNLFINIIRHGDNPPKNAEDIEGIVVIDEIDVHLHTNLQNSVLPELIKMFPKIQFIITTHSPIFLLGMEREFGEDGFEIREMPNGNKITAERFSEFENAYNVLKETEKFENEVKTQIQQSEKPILFVEGESDEIILKNAWKKLKDGIDMPFEIVNGFDCFFIKNTFKREDIFRNNPSKIFMGLLDFDEAYECWKEIREKKQKWNLIEDNEEKGLLLKHKAKNGALFLLPVPTDKKDFYASSELGKKSALSIEFLFSDKLIEGFCNTVKCLGGSDIKKFKDSKKKTFSNSTNEFSKEDFKNFEKIFEIIEDIIS